jgi:acyl carrier protein
MGLLPMSPKAALSVMERTIGNSGHLVAAAVDWSILLPLLETKQARPLFDRLRSDDKPMTAQGSQPIIDQLNTLVQNERRQWLCSALQGIVADVLGIASGAGVDPKRGFFEMGMDSLSALQLRKHTERWSGVKLPATLAMEAPNIEAVLALILDRVPEIRQLVEVEEEILLSEGELADLLAAELSL